MPRLLWRAETMVTDHNTLQRLREACRTRDIAQINELFRTNVVLAEDAIEAIERYSEDLDLVRCLLNNGVSLKDLRIRLFRSLEVLKVLAEFGYDFKIDGHLVLQDFCDNREALNWLLDQGVDINKTDLGRSRAGSALPIGQHDHSNKLLNNVARNGDIEMFDYLVSRGADPHRSHAVHCVAENQDPNQAVKMLSHLLDDHDMDICADTQVLHAYYLGYRHEDGTPLAAAICYENLPVIKELLRRGAYLRSDGTKDPYALGHTLGNGMEEGYLPALEPLLDAGADPTSALHYAVGQSNVEAIQICLRRGANPMLAFEEAHETYQYHSDRFTDIWKKRDPEDEEDEGCKKRDAEAVQLCQKVLDMLEDAWMAQPPAQNLRSARKFI